MGWRQPIFRSTGQLTRYDNLSQKSFPSILFFRMSYMHAKLEASPRQQQQVCTISSFCFKRSTSIHSLYTIYLHFHSLFHTMDYETRKGHRLVPQSLVPELDLRRLQVGGLRVEAGRVENKVVPALVVQGPRELVLGPHRVGVARQHKGHEVLLHLDGSGGVDRGGAAAGATRRRGGVGAGRGVRRRRRRRGRVIGTGRTKRVGRVPVV